MQWLIPDLKLLAGRYDGKHIHARREGQPEMEIVVSFIFSGHQWLEFFILLFHAQFSRPLVPGLAQHKMGFRFSGDNGCTRLGSKDLYTGGGNQTPARIDLHPEQQEDQQKVKKEPAAKRPAPIIGVYVPVH
jgi:hypothetical protein